VSPSTCPSVSSSSASPSITLRIRGLFLTVGLGSAALLTSPSSAAAQWARCSLGGDPVSAAFPRSSCAGSASVQDAPEASSSGKAFLFSALLPGSGQRYLGQGRWPVYLGLEAAGWVFFAQARIEGGDLRGDYQDLAWEVARTFQGPRVDGGFDYYESLTKFERSGSFDVAPAQPGIQPEEDVSTFNGQTWLLARQIYFGAGSEPAPGDPSYQRALDFYENRAATREFEWDWTGQAVARARFGDLIEESDEAFRRATLYVGLVVGNHVLSAVDAFVSARARSLSGLDIAVRSLVMPGRGSGPRFGIGVRIGHR
jgi:hypothetical protein